MELSVLVLVLDSLRELLLLALLFIIEFSITLSAVLLSKFKSWLKFNLAGCIPNSSWLIPNGTVGTVGLRPVEVRGLKSVEVRGGLNWDCTLFWVGDSRSVSTLNVIVLFFYYFYLGEFFYHLMFCFVLVCFLFGRLQNFETQ